jgi:hypothetical protein
MEVGTLILQAPAGDFTAIGMAQVANSASARWSSAHRCAKTVSWMTATPRLGGESAFADPTPHHQCPHHLSGWHHGRRYPNFLVHRCRMERIIAFVGQYQYKLIRRAASFKIAERKAILAQDTLRAQGTMSIIL